MKTAPQEMLKEYVRSQHFTSTVEIMTTVKEMFRDVVQTVMEVERRGAGTGTLPAGRSIGDDAELRKKICCSSAKSGESNTLPA
ncbi:MAG: hypothetical protein HFE44_14990 [Oscillospiraceae bacterium]|nr:hypothetical protein [Oscillospiraceae bacterium]